MAPCVRLWEIFHSFFLQTSARQNLISLKELVLAGDGTPVYTAAQERKNEPANVWKKESTIATVTASIISRTVTSDGTPTVTVITSDMTYTY